MILNIYGAAVRISVLFGPSRINSQISDITYKSSRFKLRLRLALDAGPGGDYYDELNIRAADEELQMKRAPCSSLHSPTLEPSDERRDYQSKLFMELKTNGVVRIDNVLSSESTAPILRMVMQEWELAKADVANGVDRSDRFSNLLSSNNRWDLKLPWSPDLAAACRQIVRPGFPLGDLLTRLASRDGVVHELAAFVSMPGACRQVLHADTLWSSRASVYTCTVALQDVKPDMGPTVFLPATHTRAAHRRFDDSKARRTLIAEAPHVLSTLSAGDAAVYDSRVLHCGGANRSGNPRVLLYLSLLDPAGPLATGRRDVSNVATIRPELAGRLTLAALRERKDKV